MRDVCWVFTYLLHWLNRADASWRVWVVHFHESSSGKHLTFSTVTQIRSVQVQGLWLGKCCKSQFVYDQTHYFMFVLVFLNWQTVACVIFLYVHNDNMGLRQRLIDLHSTVIIAWSLCRWLAKQTVKLIQGLHLGACATFSSFLHWLFPVWKYDQKRNLA